MVFPKAAELSDPGVGLLERARVDGVDAARSVDPDKNETALTKRTQMLRDGGLRDAEFVADHAGQAASVLLTGGQQLEDATPDGISENVESVRGRHCGL
ncbi:MAG TPA: hypothetical protein VHC72_02765, partial [Bryobacteraceae bacterium]|nr:hypothetical protein [Bryobacteraceae bacterium]